MSRVAVLVREVRCIRYLRVAVVEQGWVESEVRGWRRRWWRRESK